MPMKSRLCLVLLALTALFTATFFAANVSAQIRINQEDQDKERQKVSPLTWADRNDLTRKQDIVERLGQRHYGQSLRHNPSDLQLLQRIADDKIIKQSEIESLQALGVVLGNVLQEELELEWKAYDDQVGRSRALCVPKTEYCLFPLTMLSRRLEVGLPVDVENVYQDAVAAIQPYLPDQNAFDGKTPEPRDRPSWIDDRPTRPPIRIRVQ